MKPPGFHDDLRAFVGAVVAGEHAMTADDVRALLVAGHERGAIVDALVDAAADPAVSRRVHRALGLVRDTLDGRRSG
ncbi:MAG: hypothetical protein NVS3B10_25340 [Polyangiales bacterium]